jgi:hypothetical protein
VDVEAYRTEAEAFVTALSHEHYRHFAGHKPQLEVEPIYEAHVGLFSAQAATTLERSGNAALLEFCIEGLIGRATASEVSELAGREAELEVEVDGTAIPYRRATIEQSNEPDADRRAAIEAARLEIIASELDPLHERILERSHQLAEELGWSSMASMCSDLSGIDLEDLARRADGVLADTDDHYADVVLPRVGREAGVADRVRRSDLPAFFRASSLDATFPRERLVASLEATLDDLGLTARERVTLDAEVRPTKSPRAFCAAVRVPDEVYLVISPRGGRDDYEALLHEAGHAEHYAHVDRERAFELRHLGDNSITEAYAFLFQRLAAEPAWLERRLEVADPSPIADHSSAAKLVLVRRYAAKLGYELALHSGGGDAEALRSTYASRLSRAVGVDWPQDTWLADVDPFFYAARYLRAWALEAELAQELASDLGPEWFFQPDAGRRLVELWSRGQTSSAAELLGREPRFGALTAELCGARRTSTRAWS